MGSIGRNATTAEKLGTSFPRSLRLLRLCVYLQTDLLRLPTTGDLMNPLGHVTVWHLYPPRVLIHTSSSPSQFAVRR